MRRSVAIVSRDRARPDGKRHSAASAGLAGQRRLLRDYRPTPLLERTFTRDEEAGDAPVVVLSHRLWKAHTGADPDVLGKTIELDGVAHTVVGVMRAGFLDVIGGDVDVWVPQNPEPGGWNNRGNQYLTGIARLRPGASLA